MKISRRKLHIVLILAGLALTTFVAFEQVRHCGFISLDDWEYITSNKYVNKGLSVESSIWAFTTSHAYNWHPLTWLSHMLDCELFGLNPGGHHLMNLLFHIANTLLLFFVLSRMTGAVWRSCFVAALFALHPVHVESVAWVSERKDVLSMFFALLTIYAYVRYAERPVFARYAAVVVLLGLGLMAKPMLVTLPFVLLILDYWPLCRFRFRGQTLHQNNAVDCKTFSAGFLIFEKIPLLVLAAISSVITYVVQGAAVRELIVLPMYQRVGNALVSYIHYVVKMIYPSRLAILYPHPFGAIAVWKPVVCFLVLAVTSWAVLYSGRRRRYLTAGWLWYLGTLVPVIGLVQVGSQSMADRYTYLPSIGIFIMVSWGVSEMLGKWRYKKIAFGICAAAVVIVLLMLTRMQVRYWQSNFTLFEHALSVTENNYIAHNIYGGVLSKERRVDEGIEEFRKSVRINPNHSKAQYNLGLSLLETGKTEEAIGHLRKSLELNPKHYLTMINLAYAMLKSTDPQFRNTAEALRLAKQACELADKPTAGMLGILETAQGTFDFEEQQKLLRKP